MSLLTAVSSSARQLYLLLRCINFTSKAQVQILKEGLRFSVETSRVMQGSVRLKDCHLQSLTNTGFAFLSKDLFASYQFNGDNEPGTEDPDNEPDVPTFQISLPALLETLQIFGFAEVKERWSARDNAYSSGINNARGGGSAFDIGTLGMPGICRFSYGGIGEPLSIVLEEANVTTTCQLITFDPEAYEDIPFDRDRLAQKIIMRASWLYDAISELSSTSPERLTILASPSTPYFSLSATGPLGSATVEFSKDTQLLETFQVSRRTVNTYKFSLIKAAARAMAIATKVSIRGDDQGVLSLQFMIEVEGGAVSFIDFRFVPFVAEEGEEDGDGGDGAYTSDDNGS